MESDALLSWDDALTLAKQVARTYHRRFRYAKKYRGDYEDLEQAGLLTLWEWMQSNGVKQEGMCARESLVLAAVEKGIRGELERETRYARQTRLLDEVPPGEGRRNGIEYTGSEADGDLAAVVVDGGGAGASEEKRDTAERFRVALVWAAGHKTKAELFLAYAESDLSDLVESRNLLQRRETEGDYSFELRHREIPVKLKTAKKMIEDTKRRIRLKLHPKWFAALGVALPAERKAEVELAAETEMEN